MSTRLPSTEERPVGSPPTSVPSQPPAVPPGIRQRPRRRGRWLAAVLVVAVLGGLIWRVALMPPAAPATPTPAASAPKLTARGKVQPVRQARIGTLGGGVVTRVSVVVGEPVAEQQEVARVKGPNGAVEVLAAPWSGTVTAAPVNLGDTVMPGTVLVTIGDLSRLQVETTDVDEFLIGSIARGQPVRVTVDALDGRALDGVVQRITLVPQPTGDGGEHYPVVIDLAGPTADLRPGMTVRLQF